MASSMQARHARFHGSILWTWPLLPPALLSISKNCPSDGAMLGPFSSVLRRQSESSNTLSLPPLLLALASRLLRRLSMASTRPIRVASVMPPPPPPPRGKDHVDSVSTSDEAKEETQ